MGTRSLTFFHDQEKKPVVCMYGQYDGYLSGHGLDLAEFISSKTLVNGLGTDNTGVANGMECLAALAVAHFKGNQAGSFYLYPTDTIDAGEEFTYHVYSDKVVVQERKAVVFAGTWNEFLEECKVAD